MEKIPMTGAGFKALEDELERLKNQDRHDIIKAIALGADAVAGGKMHAWALGAGGEPALGRMLELLRIEIETTMALIGVTSIGELDATYVARDDNRAGSITPFPLLDEFDETQP